MPSYFDSSSQVPRPIRLGDSGGTPSPGSPFEVPENVPTPGIVEPGSYATPIAEASVVPYTPAVPGNWSPAVPHDVAQALDEVAAGTRVASTAATVAAGAVYTLRSTDAFIRFDTSGGAVATANLLPGAFIGQTVTFYWWAWSAGLIPPVVNAPAGAAMVPFTGQASSGAGGLVATTAITTPGASYTLQWDGTEWITP